LSINLAFIVFFSWRQDKARLWVVDLNYLIPENLYVQLYGEEHLAGTFGVGVLQMVADRRFTVSKTV
jgi:hypothetical protein